MGYPEKGEFLAASDIREEDVELPSIGMTVRVRALPAAYSNEAQSEALEMVAGPRGTQTARVNTVKLECLQLLHGMVTPKLDTIQEAQTFAQRCGPAFHAIIAKIDELSDINKEAVTRANAMFQPGGSETAGDALGNGTSAGGPGPDIPVRAGAGVSDAAE